MSSQTLQLTITVCGGVLVVSASVCEVAVSGRQVAAKWPPSGRQVAAGWPSSGRQVAVKWPSSGLQDPHVSFFSVAEIATGRRTESQVNPVGNYGIRRARNDWNR